MKMLRSFALLCLPALALFDTSPAQAFHIPEHQWITQRAIHGLQKCNLLPQQWDMGWSQAIQDGNKSEDTNLLRKWSKYSHFYNPKNRLQIGRADSLLSVRESEDAIQDHKEELEGKQSAFQLLGRIVHHLQDAVVPAHVVPVNHFSEDGFEKLELGAYYRTPFSISDCSKLSAKEPSALLRSTALATLEHLEGRVGYKTYKRVKYSRWSELFWVAARGSGFGEYGALGNGFGLAMIDLPDGRIAHVEPSQYSEFKKVQVELAVSTTQEAILWANQKLFSGE